MVGMDSCMAPTVAELSSDRLTGWANAHVSGSCKISAGRQTVAANAHLFGGCLEHLLTRRSKSDNPNRCLARAWRSTSPEPPSANQRRRKRRGLFQPRWQAPDFSEHPRWPHLRPAIRDEHRWLARPACVKRARENDVRLLHEWGPPHLFRLEPGAREGLSAAAGRVEGL